MLLTLLHVQGQDAAGGLCLSSSHSLPGAVLVPGVIMGWLLVPDKHKPKPEWGNIAVHPTAGSSWVLLLGDYLSAPGGLTAHSFVPGRVTGDFSYPQKCQYSFSKEATIEVFSSICLWRPLHYTL